MYHFPALHFRCLFHFGALPSADDLKREIWDRIMLRMGNRNLRPCVFVIEFDIYFSHREFMLKIKEYIPKIGIVSGCSAGLSLICAILQNRFPTLYLLTIGRSINLYHALRIIQDVQNVHSPIIWPCNKKQMIF
jgi:hypothetical protein